MKAKLNGLVRRNTAVPAQVGRSVRIGAGECGVIAAGNAIIAAVLPVDVPAIDRTSPIVGYSYLGVESIIPLVIDHILATSMSRSGERGYSQGEPYRAEGAD